MSQNIVEIKQNNSISKDSFSKKEIIADRNVTYPKVSSGTKRIAIISLLLFLIVTLFISCVYLLLSKNSKIYHNIDILSNEKNKDNINEEDNRRSLMHRAISSLNSNSMVGLERNVLLVNISKKAEPYSQLMINLMILIIDLLLKKHLKCLIS